MHPPPVYFDPVAQLRLTDPHEARALELERVGKTKKARRIRECWRNPAGRMVKLQRIGVTRGCRDRLCPSCAPKDSASKGYRAFAAIKRMRHPQHCVAHVYSRPCGERSPMAMQTALVDAVDVIKDGLLALRKKKYFTRTVDGGIASLEATYNQQWRRWDVHVHIVLDSQAIPEALVDADWKALVGNGSFHVDPTWDPTLPDADKKIAFYMTKSRDWNPEPSVETPAAIHARAEAFHGRHRLSTWGSARPPRRSPKKSP